MESPDVSPQQENQPPMGPPDEEADSEMHTVLPPEFVGLPPSEGELSPEDRLIVAERYVSELLRGYHAAGQAINRLETHVFSLFKVLLDNNIMSWEGFSEARDELQKHDDLEEFWDIKEEVARLAKIAEEAIKKEAAPSSETDSSVE